MKNNLEEGDMSNCPLVSECSLGNCTFCTQNMDCILLAILKRVEDLEAIIEKKADVAP